MQAHSSDMIYNQGMSSNTAFTKKKLEVGIKDDVWCIMSKGLMGEWKRNPQIDIRLEVVEFQFANLWINSLICRVKNRVSGGKTSFNFALNVSSFVHFTLVVE